MMNTSMQYDTPMQNISNPSNQSLPTEQDIPLNNKIQAIGGIIQTDASDNIKNTLGGMYDVPRLNTDMNNMRTVDNFQLI